MKNFLQTKLAVLVYFIVPGLVYGLFTSRLPALKAQTGALESDIGFVLLFFGAGSVVGLLVAGRFLARFGAKAVLLPALLGQFMGLALESFATSLGALFTLSALIGLCTGFNDVAMNAQGLALERRQARPVMGFFHAGYCLGGGLGALLGAFFASLGFGLAVNYTTPSIVMIPLILWAIGFVLPDDAQPHNASRKKTVWSLPLILCGLLAFLASESEGACGDWGGLLFLTEKGASEGTAASVYAVFTFCALASRLASDSLRRRFPLVPLLCSGVVLGMLGFLLLVTSSGPSLSLLSVALAGLGVGPVVPMIYSLAGRLPNLSAAQASSVVSILSYTGLLLCPPVFGIIAHHWNYSAIFITVAGLLALLLAGVLVLAAILKRRSD